MSLYVYCLAGTIDAVPALSGISGARVDLISIEDFSLLVSEFQGDAAPPVTRENALAHAAVVGSVLNETTPLPFRFGSVVTEEQLRSYLATHKSSLEAKLAQVRGCVEMSVKIISGTDDTDLDVAAESTEGPGARFLKEKRREILGSERRGEDAKQVAAWLKAQVETYVRQEEISLCPTEKLIVAAAHLISREQVAEYRGRLAEARKTRPELHFLVSGPWPPYTF
ncbi:MAG TPA: GvpL/GvpF family gas vesicle protein, partial [Pyrinomonadaceae bacterium]|nr:GvpL/GvpF family gas vesicle protein [Pyrinomonadaceae bacterium]